MEFSKEELIKIHSMLKIYGIADPLKHMDEVGVAKVNDLCSTALAIGNCNTYYTLSTTDQQAYGAVLDELMDFLSDKDIVYCLCVMRMCINQGMFIYASSHKCLNMMNKVSFVIAYVNDHHFDIETIPDMVSIEPTKYS